MISATTSASSASGPAYSRATDTKSASPRSRSASRLTVIGRGCAAAHVVGGEPQLAVLAPVQQPGPQRGLSFFSHGSLPSAACTPAARSARCPRRFSIVSIRFSTTRRYASGQCAGISVIGVDPCRANHCVSTSPAAILRASTISNARSPSFSSGTSPASALKLGSFLLGQQPVEPIDLPVQLLLQRDHPSAERVVLAMRLYLAAPGSERHRRRPPTAPAALVCCASESNSRPNSSGSSVGKWELFELGSGELV